MAGGSLGGSRSSNRSSGSFNQDVWAGQQPALQGMYQAAQDLFGNTQGQMNGLMGGATQGMQNINNAAMPNWQNQMQGGAYSGLGIGNQLMDSLNQSLNSPTAMQDVNSMIMGGAGNNYADAMKGQFMQDAQSAQNQMLSGLDARAAASGMSGGSRHGVATAQGMQDINKNLQSNMANVGYNTFDKDLDRKMQIAQQADQGTLARQQMMGGMLGNQQQTMNQGLQNAQGMQQVNMGQFAPTMMPWNAMGNYAQAIGGPQVLSDGSMTSKGSAKGAGGSGSFGNLFGG